MKKSVLTGIDQIEIIEAPVPEIKHEDDVLIRMKRVGICGSDIHYYSSGKIGSQEVQYPFTVGHEGAGVVEEVGQGVTSVKPGDPIAIEPSVSCGNCDQCKAGRPHTCRNNLFLGCPGQLEGNLAEFIVMPESQCMKLADSQNINDGATSEPLAIGLYSVRRAELSKDDAVGIIGFGPIGMSVLQMAQAVGLTNILVSEKNEARKKASLKQGVVWAGNPLKENIEQGVTKQQPDMLDVVFECSGDQHGLNTAIDLLKPGGKLVMIGIPEFDRWSFSADLGRRKEITFINIRRQNNCTHDTLSMLADGTVNGSAMITHRFRFSQVVDAFDMVKNYRDGVMKAMIEF
jgi:L-iditol 2-dehydrogenase